MKEYNYIWIVATANAGERGTETEKHFSYAMRLSSGSELKGQLESVDHAHLCGTKKQAYQLADFWNECYKANGTYMY